MATVNGLLLTSRHASKCSTNVHRFLSLTIFLWSSGRLIKKSWARYANSMGPRAIAFWITLEQLAQAAVSNGQLVYVVADQTDRGTRTVIQSLLRDYRLSGPPFGAPIEIQHIIDTVHFMESQESWHLQLCDMARFGTQRIRRAGNGDFEPIFSRLHNRVLSKRTFPY